MTHPGQLLKENKLYAGKELGQNFLSDPSKARMIVNKTGIGRHSRVLEIGGGLGALTLPLAEVCDDVTCIEKDRRLVPVLQSELAKNGKKNVNVVCADILKVDIRQIAQDKKLVVIGNLPYNISSQILIRLVEESHYIESAFLMFQKELAQRILSEPGGRSYSRLSAVVSYAMKIRWITDIGPASFFPKPSVDSTVLRFDPIEKRDLPKDMEALLFKVIKAAFSKRRKSLRNALAGGELKLEKIQAERLLEAANISPGRRAETLNVEDFCRLTLAMKTTEE